MRGTFACTMSSYHKVPVGPRELSERMAHLLALGACSSVGLQVWASYWPGFGEKPKMTDP